MCRPEPRESLADHVAHALGRAEPVQRSRRRRRPASSRRSVSTSSATAPEQERVPSGQLDDRRGPGRQAVRPPPPARRTNSAISARGEARQPQPRRPPPSAGGRPARRRALAACRPRCRGTSPRRACGRRPRSPEVAQEQQRRDSAHCPSSSDEQDGLVPAGRDQEIDDGRWSWCRSVSGRPRRDRAVPTRAASPAAAVRARLHPPEVVAERPDHRADEPAERLHERPVRRRHDGVAGAVEHERAGGGRLLGELAHEPALPRAGLAGDARDPACPRSPPMA